MGRIITGFLRRSAHKPRVERVGGEVLVAAVGDKNLIFKFDAEIATNLTDQCFDTKCRSRPKLVVECSFDPMVGIGYKGPFIAETDAVEAARVFSIVVFRIKLVAPEDEFAD